MQIIYLHRTSLEDGAGEEIRTPDLRITNALLYQLSYTRHHLSVVRKKCRSTEDLNYEQGMDLLQE